MSPKKSASHAPKGSGGVRRHRLKGKGPTPKAANRPYHQAYRDRLEAERKATHTSGVTQRAAARDRYRPNTAADSEIIFGRNPVVEAAAAGVPLKRLFVSASLMKDERLSKVVQRGKDTLPENQYGKKAQKLAHLE